MERTSYKQGTIQKYSKKSVAIREHRLRFAGYCWKSQDALASDLLLWRPSLGKRSQGRPLLTYIDQLVILDVKPKSCLSSADAMKAKRKMEGLC